MTAGVEIQDIESMRLREGIDDVELREAIRRLRVGDIVKLTFITGSRYYQTLPVRITRIRGTALRGILAAPPSALSGLKAGLSVAFTHNHIHSVLKQQIASK